MKNHEKTMKNHIYIYIYIYIYSCVRGTKKCKSPPHPIYVREARATTTASHAHANPHQNGSYRAKKQQKLQKN